MDLLTEPSAAEIHARLLLHQQPGVGPVLLGRLVARCGGAVRALTAGPEELARVVGPKLALELADRPLRQRRLRAALSTLEGLGAWARVAGQPGYPAGLLELSPPPVLYGRGRLPSAPAVAVVGKRRASGRAISRARELAAELCAAGFVVVSGGAYGIDGAAHAGALDAGGQTVVVFGGGLDRPYPERHIALFERAVAHGAVLSPFRPGTPPVRGGFLARNGLIAALGAAVVVVEAGWRSGSRSTALAARRLERPLLAVPGSPGADRLIAEGAAPVGNSVEALRLIRDGAGSSASGSEEWPLTERPGAATHMGAAPTVLEALATGEPTTAEALALRLGRAPAAVLAELMTLVLEGRVLQQPGGGFRRV